ncbi:MAG: AAA domain-containing protein [Halobacteriovoraceae bacterium]|jgi:ATP-dependent Clp protease ATP-binding subunit ClpB|nr:AAA domain-containing protein [Halobacteriovoraceae bacterium]
MNNFDKVVTGSLDIAQAKALELKNTELAPIHLLYGLTSNPSSYASKALLDNAVQIEELLTHLPASSQALTVDQIRPSANLSSWLTQAGAHATKSGKQEICEKNLLRFLPNIFPNLNIDYAKLGDFEDEQTEVPAFLINLNDLATAGKLDPVIGRTKEIRAVMEILGRRSKNNPVLVGPAGVGKTAIIEGLAESIVKGIVPDVLKGKTVYSLELGSLVAGTKYRGEFEERIQHLLKFAKEGAGQYIIFIDEIHQIIGAGKTDGAMDAANLLKPALSRGDLHCIGATTEDEFQKHILKDPALERRFRQVPVWEPTKEDSIEILMGLKEKFEAHHGIKITDDAVYSAVMLSDQYITDKNLPDKAIDLIDESASALKLSAEAMPAELELLQSEIRNKRILAQVESNKELEKEVTTLQAKFDIGFVEWEQTVNSLKKVGEIKNRLERLKFDLEKAEREQSYEEASKLKYSMIPEVQKELEVFNHDWELTRDNIGSIIARQTGIPVEKILKSKQDNILELEKEIKQKVFGQDEVIHEISETLLASYAGLTDQSRPLGSFLLKGPTGVGKTETAKALASFLFDNEENIVRLDMSEFSEKHSVAKLIGAPAGYVGYDDGGVLTEAIRRRPHSVILFDEIEKAHPDFSDILLQILDDGRLSDNKGRTINFKNTIILLTTNSKNIEMDFKPEVLGRLDGALTYNSLDRSVMHDLVLKQVKLLKQRVKSQHLELNFSEPVIKHLADIGYDDTYGARPLASMFSRLVIRPLSKMILAGNYENKIIRIDINAGKIELTES